MSVVTSWQRKVGDTSPRISAASRLRIEYPGAVHHTMSRGNFRQSIFEAIRQRLLKTENRP
jgi:hypothetical protein